MVSWARFMISMASFIQRLCLLLSDVMIRVSTGMREHTCSPTPGIPFSRDHRAGGDMSNQTCPIVHYYTWDTPPETIGGGCV